MVTLKILWSTTKCTIIHSLECDGVARRFNIVFAYDVKKRLNGFTGRRIRCKDESSIAPRNGNRKTRTTQVPNSFEHSRRRLQKLRQLNIENKFILVCRCNNQFSEHDFFSIMYATNGLYDK